MSAFEIAAISFLCVLGGALAGLALRPLLPEHHLGDDSKDVVKVVTGLMATLSALVLGLLIASAKSSFDAVNDGFEHIAAKVIVLDRVLAQYGPGAKEARDLLRSAYAARVDRMFPTGSGSAAGSGGAAGIAVLRDDDSSLQRVDAKIRGLAPADDLQRGLKSRAEQVSQDLTEARWLNFEQASSTTPAGFLVVLVSWLAAMFAGFGLFAPRNGTALAALAIGALAVSTSIFLIEEMGRPLGGLITISAGPMRDALAVLGR